LYVHSLQLARGLDQIGGISGDGMNIYYDINNPANSYLGGGSYALGSGGSIAPVPEPYLALWAAMGMAGLAMRRRLRGRGD
jgi:hypothetical protein